MYINQDGELTTPPISQYLCAVFLPEEEIVNATIHIIPFTNILKPVLSERFAKELNEDIEKGRIDNYLEAYDNIGSSNPMSACYAQTFNTMLGTDYRTAYLCLPKDYDEDKTYPLVVYCHGYMGNWKLYQGIFKDLDNAIVLSIGTKDMSGLFTTNHIEEIFSFYIPLLERMKFKIDQSSLHLIGLSNGGTAIQAGMLSSHSSKFKSFTTISCNIYNLKRVKGRVNFIGGGQDPSANQEPAECRILKQKGVDANILFYDDENHFVLVNKREECIDFLKDKLDLRKTDETVSEE